MWHLWMRNEAGEVKALKSSDQAPGVHTTDIDAGHGGRSPQAFSFISFFFFIFCAYVSIRQIGQTFSSPDGSVSWRN